MAVLDRLPMVNLHFSLLPRWRGAAPVERALLEGDAETGVCLMAVEAGLDTGPVYAEVATAIDPEETVDELRARLVAIGCRMLEEHLADGRAGLPRPRDQAGNPTYAEKVAAHELELDWHRAGGPSAPGGAARPGVDDVPGPAAAGAGRRRRPPSDDGRPTARPRASSRGRGRGRGEGPASAASTRPARGQATDGRRRLAARRPPGSGDRWGLTRTSAPEPEPEALGPAPVGSWRWPPSTPRRHRRPPCGWPRRSCRPTSAAWPTPWPGSPRAPTGSTST